MEGTYGKLYAELMCNSKEAKDVDWKNEMKRLFTNMEMIGKRSAVRESCKDVALGLHTGNSRRAPGGFY